MWVIVGPRFGACPACSKVGVGRGGRHDNDTSPETHACAAQARPDSAVALPQDARRCGWEAVLGSGPFEVVGLVGRGDRGLAANVVLLTELAEREISEVWLALADEAVAQS